MQTVRYVSIGCGKLLTDFEVLCGLQEKGLTIERIVLCDSIYPSVYPQSSHTAWVHDQYARAFQALAGFFRAEVAAFNDLKQLERAAREQPEAYGQHTTFVWCDAADISTTRAHELAEELLLPGGYCVELHNSGGFGASSEGCLLYTSPSPRDS